MLQQIIEILGICFIIVGLLHDNWHSFLSKLQIIYGFVIILFSKLFHFSFFEKIENYSSFWNKTLLIVITILIFIVPSFLLSKKQIRNFPTNTEINIIIDKNSINSQLFNLPDKKQRNKYILVIQKLVIYIFFIYLISCFCVFSFEFISKQISMQKMVKSQTDRIIELNTQISKLNESIIDNEKENEKQKSLKQELILEKKTITEELEILLNGKKSIKK